LLSLPEGDDSSGKEIAKQHYSQLSKSSNPTIKIQALYSLCLLKMGEGDDQSITEMKELLSLAEKSSLDVNNYQLCYGLGRAYALIRKDYKRAIQYFEQSRVIQQELQGEEGILALPWYFTNYALAEAYGGVRRIADAVNLWRLCVDIDRSLKLERRLAKSLHMLGRELCIQGNYSEAKEHLAESMVLIEKHNIQNGAKRSHFQWMAVALWNLGEYENAVECCMHHVHQCELDGAKHHPLPVVMTSDLRADAGLIKSREEGAILFALPQPYDLNNYYNWVKIVAQRRPELAYLANRLTPADRMDGNLSSSNTRILSITNNPKIGRNEKCPCGSDKKYKKCCMPR
jgi:tetratricopeptide (TPR) repeat protein